MCICDNANRIYCAAHRAQKEAADRMEDQRARSAAFRASDLGFALEALSVTITDLSVDKHPAFAGMYDEVLAVVGEDCFMHGSKGNMQFIQNAMGGLRVFGTKLPHSLLRRITEVEQEARAGRAI